MHSNWQSKWLNISIILNNCKGMKRINWYFSSKWTFKSVSLSLEFSRYIKLQKIHANRTEWEHLIVNNFCIFYLSSASSVPQSVSSLKAEPIRELNSLYFIIGFVENTGFWVRLNFNISQVQVDNSINICQTFKC